MLLTVTAAHRPATDLGFLLHKNPARYQSLPFSFDSAYVFHPEALHGIIDFKCDGSRLVSDHPRPHRDSVVTLDEQDAK
jgi:hypothetical protein